jgi:NAD(P)-dependent dehydrogenase (short-subunit alcohol dehydrogenase family)
LNKILKDKVAVITGSGRGVGKGIAKLMAYEGAKVVIVDPGTELDGSGGTQSIAESVVKEILQTGGEAVASFEDITTMSGGESVVQHAIDTFGKLDIVVTCAGVLRDRMIFNMTEEEWDSVIAVHLKGTFTIVKHAAMLFRQQRSGRIITFSSTSGLIGNTGQANYGAAKDGVAGFTRVVARDLGRYGITCNSIAPSANTRMIAAIPESSKQAKAGAGIASSGGGDLRGDADDIAPFTTWLASDQAHHVNGHVFYVTAGLVSQLNDPEPIRTIRKEGRWTLDELIKVFPITLGVDLYNPAPTVTQ